MPDQPKKQGGSLFLTAVLGLVGAMIPTLVIVLFVRSCEDPVMERNYRYQREKRAKRLAQPEEVVPARVVEESPDTLKDEPSAFLTLEEGLLALAPGIYLSVRFLLENGEALSPNELKQSEGVHTIEITVNSEPWDSLKPEDRVELLNTTFRIYQGSLPEYDEVPATRIR